MRLTRRDLLDYSARYVDITNADFPFEGDLFYFTARRLPRDKVLQEDEGWKFGGYGHCTGYDLDEESVPPGKWIYMRYLDLTRIPMEEQFLKLQPPHVLRGRFQTEDRSIEIRIHRCSLPHRRDGGAPAKRQTPKMPSGPKRGPGGSQAPSKATGNQNAPKIVPTVAHGPDSTPPNVIRFPGSRK